MIIRFEETFYDFLLDFSFFHLRGSDEVDEVRARSSSMQFPSSGVLGGRKSNKKTQRSYRERLQRKRIKRILQGQDSAGRIESIGDKWVGEDDECLDLVECDRTPTWRALVCWIGFGLCCCIFVMGLV